MDRRQFLQTCAVVGGVDLAALEAVAGIPPRLYTRARLVDAQGTPLRAQDLAAGVNYLFNYPHTSTPCFLLNLGRPVGARTGVRGRAGDAYDWQGGVGPERSIVAFSAICAHRLAYPTREISFIRYQRRRSSTSDGDVIHCCADHSVYDPASGAAVVKGPAEHPLAAIVLDYDSGRDELHAIGTQGRDQFEAFFRKYEFRLAMEYGAARARASVEGTAVVKEMNQYCRQTVEC